MQQKIVTLALGTLLANVCLTKPAIAQVSEEAIAPSAQTKSERLESDKSPDFLIAQSFGTPTAEILLEALEVANTIEDAAIKAGIFSEIAGKYAQIGEAAIALDILSEAL